MSKQKKELTTKERIKKYRNLKVASRVGEFVVLPLPISIMAIVNQNSWFPNAEAGAKVGLGGGIAIALGLFVTWLVTREQERESKITGGYISIMLLCALIAAIATLVRDIANQIAEIMWVEMSGIGAGFGLDLTRKKFLKKEQHEREILKIAEDKRAVERANEEIAQEEQRKIKIKVKN